MKKSSFEQKIIERHISADSADACERFGNFSFYASSIEGLKLVVPRVFGDHRGSFQETYQQKAFEAAGINSNFVQDNQSSSQRGVLRGLHFQIAHPQAKLVRVLSGEVFDVAVDLRPGSSTWGSWIAAYLSAENAAQLYIPRGMAHGFLVLSESASFAYKCDELYHPEDEGGLAFGDPDLAIAWPYAEDQKLLLSDKDKLHPSLQELAVSSGIQLKPEHQILGEVIYYDA